MRRNYDHQDDCGLGCGYGGEFGRGWGYGYDDTFGPGDNDTGRGDSYERGGPGPIVAIAGGGA